MKPYTRNCQVCGEHANQRLFVNAMVPLDGLDMSYSLVRCLGCGFHYAQNLPEEAQYLHYYNELSKYDSQPKVSELDEKRIQVAVELCESLQISKDARIIDLGCGFGALLAALRDAGWRQLQGLDPAPQSARQAMEQFGLRGIHQGTLAQAEQVVNLAQADLVCLMAVMEHLPELRRDFSGLLSKLRPGARILVEVPALNLFAEYEGEPFGELSIEHIQFFSTQSLHNFFASFGASVLDMKLLALPKLSSGSLFALAELDGVFQTLEPESPFVMDAYLAGSERRWSKVLQRVPDAPFILYGAGSHSARLIPQLNDRQIKNLVAVLDGNANLHGKKFGNWIVQPPGALAQYPGVIVLISSYRSEAAIARELIGRFPRQPLQLMYSNA